MDFNIKIGVIKTMIRIKLTPEEIQNNPFLTKEGKAGFYRFIRKKFETAEQEVDCIDCRKINVAENIQLAWYDYARANNIDKTELTMLLAIHGPKAFDSLPDNTVEIEDDCFTLIDK